MRHLCVSKDARGKKGELRAEGSKHLAVFRMKLDPVRYSQILLGEESVCYSLLKVIHEVFKNTQLRST